MIIIYTKNYQKLSNYILQNPNHSFKNEISKLNNEYQFKIVKKLLDYEELIIYRKKLVLTNELNYFNQPKIFKIIVSLKNNINNTHLKEIINYIIFNPDWKEYLINNDKINDLLFEYINNEYEKRKKIYPKIYNTLTNHKKNVYFITAHGGIMPNDLFFVPHNLSIILTTTPGYYTYATITEGNLISEGVIKYFLEKLKPGISYRTDYGKKNQLRFFKSGDIINNTHLNFIMDYSNEPNKTWQGGIIKYYDYHKQSYKSNDGKPLLTHHIKNDNKNRPSWPFINEINYESNLNKIVKQFHGKKGHYVLIVGSCQIHGDYNNNIDNYTINNKNLKNKSLIYKYQKLLTNKLNCFQDLSKKIDKNKEKRLQNFSSTYKKENCYNEIMRKIKKH